MNKIQKTLSIFALLICGAANLWGQGSHKLTGKILSTDNQPVEGAIVTILGTMNVTTPKEGTFKFEVKDLSEVKEISVWAPGYFSVKQLLKERTEIVITLTPETEYKYNETMVLPFRREGEMQLDDYTAATNIAKKDFMLGTSKIDRALAGQVAGLQMKRSSGMPGEGSYYNLRGIRTLTGDNAPLIVINGIPHMPDKATSSLLGGLSRDIFQFYHLQDIANITVLKGAEAAMYGSMGSNGVILIETDGTAANDLETRVSYHGTFGVNWNNKRMPLLGLDDYKHYLADIGMTISSDPNKFYNSFPFMKDPNDVRYNYLYNNNTDWQDKIYKNSISTDHLFRVEGGDNIAKYDLSLGYYRENGLMDYTSMERFHTLLNANALVNKNVNIFATVGLAYLTGHYQPQGMDATTNPILAAYARSPFLSPYEKDSEGNTLSSYASHYYGSNKNLDGTSKSADYSVSNPLAIINKLDARNRQYDLNMKAGIIYNPLRELTLTGTVGLYYNYNNEHIFVPGETDPIIKPITDVYGERKNSVSDGVAETVNFFANLNANYKKTYNYVHRLNAIAGWQVLTTKNEYDAGEGRNTGNDFYQTLGDTKIGQRFLGYVNNWNWMNFYGHADYTYNEMVQASVNVAVDAASSTGTDANRFYMYPSVGLTLLGKGWKPLMNAEWIDKLNVRAEYSLTGNSRFSSQMGGYYYSTLPYMYLSTIVRSNIPNVSLKPEKNASLNIGLDFSVLRRRLNVSVDYYNNQVSDMISSMPLSSVYGSIPYYANVGKMENKGIELSAQAALIRTRDFEWIVGGNISKSKDKIKSLGGEEQIVLDYGGGVQMVHRVGESPYQFYGYQADGVFSTQAEADAANLTSHTGERYNAGDVRFVDQNSDNRINDKDRVLLGSASPSYFGGFYTQLKYKGFAVSAEFSYSKGNKAYNAVRQQLESVSTTNNQSVAVMNRWSVEGQKTDMPKAAWKDPVGNSYYSSRWMEDASYLKMKNLTVSYTFSKTLWNFFRSGTVYVTGENLLTFTDYLGMDPEFSYSYAENMQGLDYAKMMQPRTVKMGVNLKF
ncbi:SusC/RagA family TonB-linked outer membrane protein [Bacteroides sp. 224]|uniref:SusC/RagA family TonB-linked outer membrane protein n=1 Tax=Bacteroides sp. 224 TaxID=2302936 RepID=UPI0013D7C675|nr:SusC/RagA family TonB-linked outer membrane protein [Bacteroides sp. 224]NDV63655.1 SusC/RagA family TonB-linked outer membrane protein [Bacteroides sp. 224]